MGCGASKDGQPAVGGGGHMGKGPAPGGGPSGPRPKRDNKYKNNGPHAKLLGGSLANEKAMFEGKVANQLYRYIIGDKWFFYNDGFTVELNVTFTFGPDSVITPLGRTDMEKVEDGFKCTLGIFPGDTEPFIEGDVNGYSCSFNSSKPTQEYLDKVRNENQELVNKAEADAKRIGSGCKTSEELLAKCLKENVPFFDYIEFPAGDSANFRSGVDDPIDTTQWLRPTEFLPDKFHKYVCIFNNIEPNDIDQGSLGDCYYLCSLASLAEFPSKVIDIFAHPVSNSKLSAEHALGAYRVTLNKGGWWEVIVVDDFFPCVGRAPRYARNREDPSELWVMLLEKAYAKAHGSYSAITGGDALQALQDLTGYPYSRIDDYMKADNLPFFKRLAGWDTEKALITVSTPGTDTAAYAGGGGNNDGAQAKYDKAGLAMGHAYSVLTVVKIDNYHMVKIRNPWGNGVEWTGKWGDDDENWTNYPNVAKACNFEKSNDGTFWMEWEDVCSYFTGGGVCFTKFDWSDYRIHCHASNAIPNLALEIHVTKKVEVFLSVHQKDKRGLKPDDPDATYAAFTLAVSRQAGPKQKVHMHTTLDVEEPTENPNFVQGRDISMRYVFEPEHSPYLAIPRIYDKTEKDFVVSVISDHAVGKGISINFRDLGAKCPVYDNYLSFDYDSNGTPKTKTTFQYNPEVGSPITSTGDEITH